MHFFVGKCNDVNVFFKYLFQHCFLKKFCIVFTCAGFLGTETLTELNWSKYYLKKSLVLGLHYVCLCEFYYKFKTISVLIQSKTSIWKSKNIFLFWSICSALNKFIKRVNNVRICYIIQSNLSIADTCGSWKVYLLQPGIRYIEVPIFFREKAL